MQQDGHQVCMHRWWWARLLAPRCGGGMCSFVPDNVDRHPLTGCMLCFYHRVMPCSTLAACLHCGRSTPAMNELNHLGWLGGGVACVGCSCSCTHTCLGFIHCRPGGVDVERQALLVHTNTITICFDVNKQAQHHHVMHACCDSTHQSSTVPTSCTQMQRAHFLRCI